MKAVVLVGGEGTRLRPLTLTTPKQMLPIVEIPMIERVLGQLKSHGIDEAILSLGYLPAAFVDAYPDGDIAGVHVTYAVEPEPLDTAGAVRFAADFGEVDETFVVCNGDVISDMNVSGIVAFHRERSAEGTIAVHPVADPSAYGVVPTDDEGRVTSFVEKPPRDEAPTNLINAGTYVLEPSFLKRVPAGRRVSIERETFPSMVKDACLFAMADESYWLDTGTPTDFLRAHHDLIDGTRAGHPTPGARRGSDQTWLEGQSVIAGSVKNACYIGDQVTISAGATVDRSIIGPGCSIESGAVVRDSVLLAGSRIAAGSSVSGSVLGFRSTVGERCDVRPVSVLGHGAVLPSGTTIDGARVPG